MCFSHCRINYLAEKRILETEIKAVIDSENGRLLLKPVELSQRFDSSSGTKANFYPSSLSHLPTLSNQFPLANILRATTVTRSAASSSACGVPLDNKAQEMKDNLLVLEVQITSASGELQKLKALQAELTPLAAVRRWICNWCYESGHIKTTCKARPCESSNNCKIRENQPEIKNQIWTLQAELKDLQKQQEKQKSELENFLAARVKTASSFSVMRPRLRMQNLPKYTDCLKLVKDLLVLQRAMKNEIPQWIPEEGDWQLPVIIERYHHTQIAAYLPAQRYLVDLPSVQSQADELYPAGAYGFP